MCVGMEGKGRGGEEKVGQVKQLIECGPHDDCMCVCVCACVENVTNCKCKQP